MGTSCSRQKSPPNPSSAGDDDHHAATAGGEKQAQTATAPHKFQEIETTPSEKSISDIATSEEYETESAQEDQTEAVILVGKTKKYWVDEKTGYKCFMLFPRGLSITWGEDPRYWRWYPREEASDTEVEMIASLRAVCWLDIRGKEELSYLTPGVPYDVAFEVMFNKSAEGWDHPVMLELRLPDGTVRQREEVLQEKPKGQWLEIKVGEVKAEPGLKGLMEISMSEHSNDWKSGLVLKGIKIVPKA